MHGNGEARLRVTLLGTLEVCRGDVDALRFERLAAHGRDRLRAGDPQSAAELLGEAVAL